MSNLSLPPPSLRSRSRGNALVLVVALSVSFGVLVLFVVDQGHAEAREARFKLRANEALYEAFGELEKARYLIRKAGYDASGKNSVIQNALLQPDHCIPGTQVTVERMAGDTTGAWYTLAARMPYEEHYERIVTQPVREHDYFSSYLLFVAEHPAGISGQPLGSIHTNRAIRFYFPDGQYRYPVSAVEGADFLAGATPDNTLLSERFNPNADPIALETALGPLAEGLQNVIDLVTSTFNFSDPGLDVALQFYVKDGQQWIKSETWTRAIVKDDLKEVVIGYEEVNPHDETVTSTEKVSAGFEERTREVQVIDHYETVTETEEVPIYEEATRVVQMPRYKAVEEVIQVPVYKTAERTVLKKVWIPLVSSGGTILGGSGLGGLLGYWGYEEVTETYTTNEIDHYDSKTVTKQVLDGYDEKTETYQKLVGYETVTKEIEKPVYRTETETYLEEVFENVVKTETITVFDKLPILDLQPIKVKIPPIKLLTLNLPAPDNGLIRIAGNIRSLQGDIVDRITIAAEGSVKITGNLVYKDTNGDSAFLNGDKPWLPYEPNPDYEGAAALGILAKGDILYTRDVPDNFEVNASMASLNGRVGIDGIVLDENGEIIAENEFYNEYGEPINKTFKKNSIRRLGGITTAKRPVESVLRSGTIASGFNVGQAVFDQELVANPPPNFLSLDKPRFFGMTIVR